MEKKFKVYQRRDGFQVAEIATGIRLQNGMEFLARPNKSANWCTAAFNVVIDDDYELVGEDVVDCSRLPAQAICFVNGVMTCISVVDIKEPEIERWIIDIREDGFMFKREIYGRTEESYAPVSREKAAIFAAAIIQGFEPPRLLTPTVQGSQSQQRHQNSDTHTD